MSQKTMTRQELQMRLISKAQEDESFRQALLSNPRRAVEQELGGTMPQGFQVKVVEETANTLYLVLPLAEGQLSQADLDAVSGGRSSSSFATKAVDDYVFI